jgi:hypothetical protein
MKPVIAEDAARAEIDGWAEYFEVDDTSDIIDSVLPAVMRGRITLDDDGRFRQKLRSPVELQNGETLTELVISEPTTEQMRNASKVKDEFGQTIKLLSIVTGHAEGVINRLGTKDLTVAGGLLGFFT